MLRTAVLPLTRLTRNPETFDYPGLTYSLKKISSVTSHPIGLGDVAACPPGSPWSRFLHVGSITGGKPATSKSMSGIEQVCHLKSVGVVYQPKGLNVVFTHTFWTIFWFTLKVF